MKRVIERCPNCGVEHDDARGGPCEVCGTTLRYWCRVHSKEIGWLDAPACPACAAEAEAAARRPPPPPPRAPAETPSRPRRRPPVVVDDTPTEWMPPPAPPPYAGRDPREVFREGAEELGPYVVTGASLAVRLFLAVLAVIRNVIVWGVLGAIGGGVYASSVGGDLVFTALFGAMVGGGIGLFFGLIAALRVLFASSRRVR